MDVWRGRQAIRGDGGCVVSETVQEWLNPKIDRSGWSSGPWDAEPDKVQWVDATAGLDCLIVRNRIGALCGYVGVGHGHPWHGAEYGYGHSVGPKEADCESYCGHFPAALVDVHGGLTYSDRCQPSDNPAEGICHVPEPGRPEDVWWFGFDCAHAGDLVPGMHYGGGLYWTVDMVTDEVRTLARQLANAA